LSLPGHLAPSAASTTASSPVIAHAQPALGAVEVPLTDVAPRVAAGQPQEASAAAQAAAQPAAQPKVEQTATGTAASGLPTPTTHAASAVAANPKLDQAKTAGAAAHVPAQHSGGYALQVGACRLPSCVGRYRELISPHLKGKAGAARLVQIPGDHGQGGLQRLRVEPLDRATALELKETLAQADPRLKSAYLVALP
ncbi:MAG TPA: hypothetical protein VL359_09095, partial [bacterium]|nr:hypothetical protein [bacterium]